MRVVIADDAALFREGLARLLAEAGVEVAAQAATPTSCSPLVAEHATRTSRSSTSACRRRTRTRGSRPPSEIRERHPATWACWCSRSTSSRRTRSGCSTAREGRCGYLLKDRVLDVDELVAALERVAAGETRRRPGARRRSCSPGRRSRDPLDELTDREREVLALMAEGLTDRGIAERLW